MPPLLETQLSFGATLLTHEAAPSWGASVYRGNVFGNWASALAIAYPITRKIVGADFFEAMARQFARAHPSRRGDLHEYGGELADFLGAWDEVADLPYLLDVARMEWLAHRAFYASDPPSFEPATLASLSSEQQETLTPRLAPACSLLESAWPLARLWEIHQDDYRGEFSVDLDSGPDRVLIHRPVWRVYVKSVALGDFRFLREAARGERLGQALEAACSIDPSLDPARVLGRWIGSGVLSF